MMGWTSLISVWAELSSPAAASAADSALASKIGTQWKHALRHQIKKKICTDYKNLTRFGFIKTKTPNYIFAEEDEIKNKTEKVISHREKYTEMPLQLKKIEFRYNLAFGS